MAASAAAVVAGVAAQVDRPMVVTRRCAPGAVAAAAAVVAPSSVVLWLRRYEALDGRSGAMTALSPTADGAGGLVLAVMSGLGLCALMAWWFRATSSAPSRPGHIAAVAAGALISVPITVVVMVLLAPSARRVGEASRVALGLTALIAFPPFFLNGDGGLLSSAFSVTIALARIVLVLGLLGTGVTARSRPVLDRDPTSSTV